MFTFLRKVIEIFKVRISLTITLCAVSGVFIMPYSNSFTFKQFFRFLAKTISFKNFLASVLGTFTALGLFFAILRLSKNIFVSKFAYIYSYIFRGTPLLVQIFIIYFGLGQIESLRSSILIEGIYFMTSL